VSYDLPGFGESDPHRGRNLSSSASDMINLAAAIGIDEKFWLLGYSTGSIHTWAGMKYFPEKIAGINSVLILLYTLQTIGINKTVAHWVWFCETAGAAMVAPVINPYEPSMVKEEVVKTWEQWLTKRKFMYFLARRFPILLPFFYRRSFLSGNLDQLDQWMALSLGEKVLNLLHCRSQTQREEFSRRRSHHIC